MTREQFNAKFQGRMLLVLTEAWACRRQPPSALGLLMDEHARQLRGLLGEMFDALQPPLPPILPPKLAGAPAVNGQPAQPARAAAK